MNRGLDWCHNVMATGRVGWKHFFAGICGTWLRCVALGTSSQSKIHEFPMQPVIASSGQGRPAPCGAIQHPTWRVFNTPFRVGFWSWSLPWLNLYRKSGLCNTPYHFIVKHIVMYGGSAGLLAVSNADYSWNDDVALARPWLGVSAQGRVCWFLPAV